jgi:hypothetical protein
MLAALPALAQDTPGDVAVFVVGNGVVPLSNATGDPASINEYNTSSGALVSSTPIPSTGSAAVIYSGTDLSGGALSLSGDGSLLTFPGYSYPYPYNGSSLTSSSTAQVPRLVLSVDAYGNITVDATTTQYSGFSVRSAASDGQNNFWLGGGGGGTFYAGDTASPATVQNSITSTYYDVVQNGFLYFSTGSTPTPGIYYFNTTPLPITPTAPTLLIPTGSSSSPTGIAISPDGNTMYIGDNGSVSPGIKKYVRSGPSFVLQYTLGTGISGVGVNGLAVDGWSGNPWVYYTTSDGGQVDLIVDAGPGSPPTVKVTAPANEKFLGIAFVPTPPPSQAPPTLFYQGNNPGQSNGGQVMVPQPGTVLVNTATTPQVFDTLEGNLQILDGKIRDFTSSEPAPAFGQTQEITSGATFYCEYSTDGGATWTPGAFPASLAELVTHNSNAGGKSTYKVTVEQLQVSGDGFVLDVDPTLPSTGEMITEPMAASYMAGGFVNLNMEASLDGVNFASDESGPERFEDRNDPDDEEPVTEPSDDLPPPDGEYTAEEAGAIEAIYHGAYANGIVLKGANHSDFTDSSPAGTTSVVSHK